VVLVDVLLGLDQDLGLHDRVPVLVDLGLLGRVVGLLRLQVRNLAARLGVVLTDDHARGALVDLLELDGLAASVEESHDCLCLFCAMWLDGYYRKKLPLYPVEGSALSLTLSIPPGFSCLGGGVDSVPRHAASKADNAGYALESTSPDVVNVGTEYLNPDPRFTFKPRRVVLKYDGWFAFLKSVRYSLM